MVLQAILILDYLQTLPVIILFSCSCLPLSHPSKDLQHLVVCCSANTSMVFPFFCCLCLSFHDFSRYLNVTNFIQMSSPSQMLQTDCNLIYSTWFPEIFQFKALVLYLQQLIIFWLTPTPTWGPGTLISRDCLQFGKCWVISAHHSRGYLTELVATPTLDVHPAVSVALSCQFKNQVITKLL